MNKLSGFLWILVIACFPLYAFEIPNTPTYWRNKLDIQLAPVEIGEPGAGVKVFTAEDTVRFVDSSLIEISMWMEAMDERTRRKDGPPEPPAPSADLQSILDQLAKLDARLSAVEQKLEASRSTVQAPFKVIDSKGVVLMSVEVVNNASILTLGNSDKAATRMMVKDGDARIVATNGQNIAYLHADSNGSSTVGQSNGIRTTIGSVEEGVNGLVISSADDANHPLGEIASRAGKKLAMRLYDDDGDAVVTAGTNPAAAGAGTVRVANTQGENVAFIGTSEDGASGELGVAKKGKNTAALLSEPRMVVLYNDAGEAITTLAKSQEGTGEGGNITVRQPDGEGIFSAGYSQERGGGEACVYRAKKQNVFCLGIGVPGMGTGR